MNAVDFEIRLLSKLVEKNTESVSKQGYDECAAIILEAAEGSSIEAKVINGENGAKDGVSRPNVVLTLDAGSDTTLLVGSHFDIVQPGPDWSYPPFKLTIQDGKAYGRGTADNKSGIAAAIGAMRRLKKETMDLNLKLIAAVDEEVGGKYGMDYVLSACGVKGDAALILDAGPERIYLGASGMIWGKVVVEGLQGHGGSPFKAKNAITEAMRLIASLESYKKKVEARESKLFAPPEAPKQFVWGRFSTTMIKAGEKVNIIPGVCEFWFDRRLLPEESAEHAERELKDHFNKAVTETSCEASLEILNRQQGYHTPEDLVFVQTASREIRRVVGKNLPYAAELIGNDGSFFAKNGIPAICYGPLRSETRYHGVDEFVYLDDLRNMRNLIIALGKVEREDIVNTR